ncbi:MAG: insulinase family protein [Peptoniphilus sp.]|nr:insulinase family protein [Peptoniphilus sp.]MDD7362781.1 insulinase family protein [Bacillota bacterium]MDY6044027.1 insulinase family protein [Peptoniphilus sp.]
MNKNYTLIDKRNISELHGEVSFLKHDKTGAQLLLIDNHNHNKTFAIGFKTPPEDSTGVAHIVEHSTLSGSRKYKTKEPFMDMVASSVQTFLNAMTYPDKTLYPISSRNDKDFKQLMDVYLDAVFYPEMRTNKNIFYQEGWHPEIDGDRLVANGVVYNEMKGVYSDPSNRVSDMIRERLHPSGTYSHDSGGDPDHIPDLTFEAFLDFHSRYYHPSNSYILLAGDMDFDERLEYLDREYLSSFDAIDPKSEIVNHPTFDKPLEFTDTYDLSEEEDPRAKSYFAISFSSKIDPTPEDLLLRSFFQELLVESENGLIKKKLRDAGIGEDVYSELSASNTWDFTIISYHAEEERYEEFKEIVQTSLEELARDGIDDDILEATLEKFEFTIRRGGGAHADLLNYISALNTWLYGQNPLDGLELEPKLKALREKIGTSYFREQIKKFFLDVPHRVTMRIDPEVGKEKRLDEKRREKQRHALAALSDDEKSTIQTLVDDLRTYQETPDSLEAKQTIPKLELDDLSKKITAIPRAVTTIDGVTVTTNPLETNGIVYTNLAFDMKHLNKDELAYASILSEVFGKVATEHYSESELETEIFLSGGGFTFDTLVLENDRGYTPYFFISTGALPRQLTRGYAVLDEILTQSVLFDAVRLKTILEGMKADMTGTLLQSGHLIVSNRVRVHFNEASYVDDLMNGLDFYFFVTDLIEGGDYKALSRSLEAVAKKLFSKTRLAANLIAEKEDLEASESALKNYLSRIGDARFDDVTVPYEPNAENEAFTLNSQVNYVSKGGSIREAGYEYSGKLTVLANVLSNLFLHTEIRAKGGAYGAGIRITKTGDVATYSYRDPHVLNTVEVYDKMASFLETLDISERDLTDMIIGVMNAFDPHLAPSAYGVLDFKRYLNGTKTEEVEKRKAEAMATTVDDLRGFSSLIEDVLAQNHLVAMGDGERLRENGDLFDVFKSLKR